MTATQLNVVGEESLCCTCYLMVLNILKATKDADTKTHTLQAKVSSAHAFFLKLETNKHHVFRAHCNPLRIRWLYLQPERNLRAAMTRTVG